MSEQFGPNFAPGSFALQQSIRLVYTLRALSRGRNRASNQGNEGQPGCTDTESTHTRSATETQHNSQPETPKESWPLLLPRRRHRRRRRRRRCCCFSTRDRRAQPVSTDCFSFCVLWNARRSESAAAAAAVATAAAAAAAEQQQQQVQQQGKPKHTYDYTT